MVEESPLVRPGEVLAGKYEIVRIIGQGGMGAVFEGMHRSLGQKVAIKVLHANVARIPEAITRFTREASTAARLQSPHVARVSDVDVLPSGMPFMVMEYLDGLDLDAELRRRGRLEIQEAVDYVLQACLAMVEAHEMGIVHRDLKPHNLFLVRLEEGRMVKVLDFGISKITQPGGASVTQTSSALGTPQYMSPEQIRSAKHVDARTDIWSLGVILYELIGGRPPFGGESPTAVIAAITTDQPTPLATRRPDTPPALSAIVMRALEKDPAARFRDVRSLAEALAPYGTPALWDRSSSRGIVVSMPPPAASDAGFAPTERTEPDGSTDLAATRPQPPPSLLTRAGRRWVLWAAVGSLVAVVVGALLVLAPWEDRSPGDGSTAPTPAMSEGASAEPSLTTPSTPPGEPHDALDGGDRPRGSGTGDADASSAGEPVQPSAGPVQWRP